MNWTGVWTLALDLEPSWTVAWSGVADPEPRPSPARRTAQPRQPRQTDGGRRNPGQRADSPADSQTQPSPDADNEQSNRQPSKLTTSVETVRQHGAEQV